MAIRGPGPFDNDNAIGAFGAVVEFIREKIEESLSDYAKGETVVEPWILGWILSLRCMAEAFPTQVGWSLDHEDVQEWRDAYLSWFDRNVSKIRVKRGVDKSELRRSAEAEFNRLIKAIEQE